MNKIKFKLLVLIILFSNVIFAQNILISQGGTVNVSGGETFYDAGGAAGNDGNTSYTITLMPPPGKSVCVDFTSFSSYESLDIFDGTTTAATNIGSLKGNYSNNYNAAGSPFNTGQPALGGVVQAELKPGVFCANNTTGALTFRFTNSGSSQSTGWVGAVSTFINSTPGCTIDLTADKSSICPSQSAVLTATGTIGASALDNTFNAGVIGTGWNATPGGVAFVNVLMCQPNRGYNTNKTDNTTFAWMQNVVAPRVLESNSFDVSNGGVVSFDFRAASDDDGGNGCEANDDKEGVYVQYSTDNGTTWVNMKLMFPSVESGINGSANIGAGTYVYNWNRTTIPIPSAAQTANTKFRWYQHQSTSGSQDSWGIDDVKIIRNKTVTLTITDLSTNSVIATTTTSATLSATVSPTTTTTYRATISDGIASCFEDVTITVNGGSATTIAYPSSSVANTVTTAQNITLTNGPVTGDYTATPAGLTINATTGAVTPNTSTPGTYTISVPTSCGTAIATLAITAASCSTCATATCVVTSIIENSAALGQTNISTSINNAGDILGLTPLAPGQSTTVCVPVTVVSNSIMLGFKQKFEAAQGCGNTAEQVITYQLRPASNCNATPIPPNRTNASNVGSGFNPEWDNLAVGNYILCFTLNVTALSICNPVDLQGLGYYNVVPATVPCQDYQIKLYDDDATSIAHSGTTFSCSDAGVFLGPTTDPTDFDSGLPFQNYDINITAISGNLNNLVLNRYDAGTNVLAETLTVTPGQIVQNYFLRPAPGQYYKLDKTNAQSGTYSYTIVDVISGATVASGTWTITAGAESAASISLIPQGSGSYSGPGVTNGFDPAGVDNYTNDRGIGFFNPSLAGPGTHTITYTWNNGLAAPNNCTLTRTKIVTVTGPSAPTTTNVSICSGTTATLTASAITTGAIVKWYDASTGGNLLFTGNPFTTPTLTAATSYWVTQTRVGCESSRVKVDVTVNPNVSPTFTQVSAICSGATLSALPTSSTNGITGTWSPALNNTATTTYTFTPTTGQCATTATMTITVNPNVSPTFTQVAAICSGATLSALPTSSTNGITGTWSPALNNTATTTYTFTPTTGQCATTATMTITVNPNVSPTFTQVAAICSGATLSALPTSSTNGITGTWSPALNNTATTTYTFTPTTGQCATTATMTITVNPNVSPTFTQVVAICSGATLSALPTSSTNGITGTWSPALNNTATTTYTFTPTTGQCATTATMTITVNPNVSPTFTQVAAICSGATLSALPTSSTNGITGTWSPALNNTATTTYTFTPTTGQCATTATMTITVNPNVSPTFTQVVAICSGATLSALPTSSTNGITGTWSPALNNTATTTYTFTPTTGQCATTATMTITVNPNVSPTFTQVAAICSGATLSALPTSSTNDITGTWSPALNNTATTTYTFTPTTGQCATTATMTITVNPNVSPTFTQVAAICSGATLSALPTSSTNGITGTWSPALNNTATTTYTFTPTTGQCATTATMTITVNPNVSPTFTQVVAICSGATLSALPTSSTNGITGTWSPALNNTATTTYTFTPTTGQCATTATMTITVNPNVSPTFTQVAAICSGATLSALPTSSTNGITGTWSPALNNTATTTYTFTPTTGQCATTATMTITVNPNVSPTFTQVAAICSGATLSALPTSSTNGITGTWSPALNNTATTTYTFTPTTGQCATTATMTITVNPNVSPTFTQVVAICSGATLSALPTSSTNGITGTWSPALNNTATTTYTFTPTTGQCGLNTTMTIVVHPLPTVIPSVTTQSFCSGGTTNINLLSNVFGATFSWTATATTITGQSGSVTGLGATSINQTLVLNANQVAAGQVTYVIVAEANGCLGAPVTVVVTVNPIPNVIVSPASLAQTICSGGTTNISFSGAINNTVYSWSVVSSVGVSGALNGSGAAINQTLTTTGLSQGTVVYEVTPSLNGCTGTPQRITVTVNPVPEIFGSASHPDLCSGESTFISVSTFNATTVFNWTVDPVGVSGASAGTATGSSINIVQPLTTTGNTRGYVDYIITPVLTGCPGIPITVRVYVNPLPVVSLTDGTICVDAAGVPFQTYVLDSGLNDLNYDFVWTFDDGTIPAAIIPGANSATYTATQVGTYTVVATNSTTNCVSNIASAVVSATNPATNLTVTQSEYFSDNATLVVTVTGGNGTLLYQLDQGVLQESNVFTGVSAGLHIITVVDTQGCTYLTQEVLVIDYPKYFTPNGDGHNDTWNIIGLNQSDAKLYIFDRYGKLLKQLSATSASEGWNGIYNNEKLPSTDYWFTLDYTENGAKKQFKAHFSLIR